MISKIKKAIKDKEIREKILFIIFGFFVFRIMANIPVPGIEIKKMAEFLEKFEMMGLFNLFTGGAFENISIVMLGVGPFIIAEIALELLTTVSPKLKELYKERGEEGRREFIQYARILTVPLSMLEGYGMIRFLVSQNVISQPSLPNLLQILITVAAATLFLVWIGEQMTEKGIGNGISLLIFGGIVSQLPSNLGQLIFSLKVINIFSLFLFAIFAVFILTATILVNEGRRNIPVVYTKRIRGRRIYGGTQTFLPIPVNPTGVIPIIFALSLLNVPTFFLSLLAGFEFFGKFLESLLNFFNNPIVHSILYIILIFIFTFFYSSITFEPAKIANDLQKIGAFIPGIRPGKNTEKYLESTLNYILPLGALFLSLVALFPIIVSSVTKIHVFRFLIGGTSLLILVSTILETTKAIVAEVEMKEYEL